MTCSLWASFCFDSKSSRKQKTLCDLSAVVLNFIRLNL